VDEADSPPTCRGGRTPRSGPLSSLPALPALVTNEGVECVGIVVHRPGRSNGVEIIGGSDALRGSKLLDGHLGVDLVARAHLLAGVSHENRIPRSEALGKPYSVETPFTRESS
jgi:hypothetical protein